MNKECVVTTSRHTLTTLSQVLFPSVKLCGNCSGDCHPNKFSIKSDINMQELFRGLSPRISHSLFKLFSLTLTFTFINYCNYYIRIANWFYTVHIVVFSWPVSPLIFRKDFLMISDIRIPFQNSFMPQCARAI